MSEEPTPETTPANEEQYTPVKGRIREMGILDLRAAKTPEDLREITSIEEVGVVLIPEHLAVALAGIPMHEVGTIAAIPVGANIQAQIGQIYLTGEALAAGDPETILVVVGQLWIKTLVTQVSYKEVRVIGQAIAPRGSEAGFGAKLSVQGQIIYIPAEARLMMGDETWSRAFLELLPKPTPFVIMGNLTVAADVTVELLQNKVPEIVLMGHIGAPAVLVPLLQVLTIEKMGDISANEGDAEPEGSEGSSAEA